MADDLDSGLSVNFFTSKPDGDRKDGKKKERITGSRVSSNGH